MIPDEVIEQVRDAADIVGVIGESVELKKTGADYRGPCPFHGGTHRNFSVNPRRGFYYCFVCHTSGDVFRYLMSRFGMDYPTAVREVARRSGIVIPERPAREGPDPRAPLFSAASAAHDWFMRQLREHPDAGAARDYLAGRDLPIETAAELGLGYAPGGPAFLAAMQELGVAEEILLQAGLAFRRDSGQIVPRFRGRLLFPIHDLQGRVVAFGGRLLGPGEPKYLNSPESDIFHKGRSLYNLHQAKHAIRRDRSVILVEGYFDVLRLVLAGVEPVVAPLGTALTADQAALLRRFAETATLLYDSDQAGLRATFRAGDELLRHGVRVRVATMPPGEDPDSLVRAGGAAALEPVLRDAVDVLERKIQLLERRGWFQGVEHRRDALDRLLPTLRAAADAITRELYLSLVAERVGVSREALEGELTARAVIASAAERARPPAPPPAKPAKPRRGASAEHHLLRVLLEGPEWLRRARDEVRDDWFEHPPYREIFLALRDGADGSTLPERLSPEARLAWIELREATAKYGTLEPDRTYVEAVRQLEARPHIRAYEELCRRVDAARDPEQKAALMGEKVQMKRELQARYPEEWQRQFQWASGGRRSSSNTGRQRRPNAS